MVCVDCFGSSHTDHLPTSVYSPNCLIQIHHTIQNTNVQTATHTHRAWRSHVLWRCARFSNAAKCAKAFRAKPSQIRFKHCIYTYEVMCKWIDQSTNTRSFGQLKMVLLRARLPRLCNRVRTVRRLVS